MKTFIKCQIYGKDDKITFLYKNKNYGKIR